MIHEQFSLMQLVLGMLSSTVVGSAISAFVTYATSRKQNMATVDETVRKTLGEVIADLRNQIKFLNEQILSALTREEQYILLIGSTSNENHSLRAELSASQLSVKNLQAQKLKYEQKLTAYEIIKKRAQSH